MPFAAIGQKAKFSTTCSANPAQTYFYQSSIQQAQAEIQTREKPSIRQLGASAVPRQSDGRHGLVDLLILGPAHAGDLLCCDAALMHCLPH